MPVLVGGEQVGNYRNNGTCSHTSTQSYNQSVKKKRIQEIDLVNKGNQKWYQPNKAEQTNTQSEKLSLRRLLTEEYSKESTAVQLTWWEKRKWRGKKEEKEKEKRKRERKEKRRKRGKERREKKNRKAKINRHMWKNIYIYSGIATGSK